jgi:ferrous iron transport protein A
LYLLIMTPSFPSLRLDQCRKGALLRIVELKSQPLFGSQDERVTLRLRELGFIPGAVIKVIGVGFLGGDPLAVLVNGTKFALRRAEAAKIAVETFPGNVTAAGPGSAIKVSSNTQNEFGAVESAS